MPTSKYLKNLSFLSIFGFISGCGATSQPPSEPDATGPELRVLTYNVNFGLAGDEETLQAIGMADADVVVLQETTPGWETAIRERFEDDYRHMLFHHSGGAGGLAVLARFPLQEQRVIEATSGWFPALWFSIDGPIGRVQLLAVHLRPPVSDSGSVVSGYITTPSIREQEISDFLEHLDPDLPTILAGDFNERNGRAMEVLRVQGFRSALPELRGRETTWRWETSVGEVRAQLDHVAYDKRLVPRSAEVIDAGRSDHLPVLAVFEARSE